MTSEKLEIVQNEYLAGKVAFEGGQVCKSCAEFRNC